MGQQGSPVCWLGGDSDNEASTSFVPSAFENGATGCGAHAFAKTVRPFAADITGLIRSFHWHPSMRGFRRFLSGRRGISPHWRKDVNFPPAKIPALIHESANPRPLGVATLLRTTKRTLAQ